MAKHKMTEAQADDWWQRYLEISDIEKIVDPSTRWNCAKLRMMSEFRLPVPRGKRFAPAVRAFALREITNVRDCIHRDRIHVMAEALGWAVALGESELAQELLLGLPTKPTEAADQAPEFDLIPVCVSEAFHKLFGADLISEYNRLRECAYMQEQHELGFDEMREGCE